MAHGVVPKQNDDLLFSLFPSESLLRNKVVFSNKILCFMDLVWNKCRPNTCSTLAFHANLIRSRSDLTFLSMRVLFRTQCVPSAQY